MVAKRSLIAGPMTKSTTVAAMIAIAAPFDSNANLGLLRGRR
jgi:hypothetical protein